jgi:non-ribosomal peptide synthetase-like protein
MIRLAKKTTALRQTSVDVDCLHERFEAQVDQRPAQTAIICRDKTISYRELDDRANQLARYLREHYVGPGKLVGIYFDRSEEPIIAILAVLKAGAGYVPIDPVFPQERARHILEEANVSVLLTERALSTNAEKFFDGAIIPVDECTDIIAAQSADRLPRSVTGVQPGDLCYVLYTSGTTGRPKGVMTEHRNVVSFVDSFNEEIRLDHNDRVFHGFSLGFDGSVEEMWMAFSNGATLVVGTADVVKFGDEVARLFAKKQVTVFSTVPTFLSMITKELPSVRLIIVSGEPCPPDLVKKWAHPKRRMLNVYGPTETTVNTTVFECRANRPVTIGRPLRGYETLILDEHMQPVPPGQSGELYIGGSGVARGYFNQPELTARQFVNDPRCDDPSENRLYRTGDLVCLTEDEELQFIRRIDRQVKIRGYRIELSEIESVLRELAQVHQAVVTVFDRKGLKELAAFVVPHCAKDEFDRDTVLGILRDRLPAYMVPGYLDLIDEMPTLASGKADRTRLPEPATPLVLTTREVAPPETELETQILSVWENLFKISPISCDDDFFMDLGGYSLLAAQLVTSLRAQFDIDVAIRDLYQHSTIRQLAQHIDSAPKAETQPSPDDERKRRTSREVFESTPRWSRWCCLGLQAIALPTIYGLYSVPLLVIILLTAGLAQGTVSLGMLTVTMIAMLLASTPLSIMLTVFAKWLIIGRYKPGKYPLWSIYYFRWWLVTRIQSLCGISRYIGSPLMSFYFRMMGAEVGRNCQIDTHLCTAFDLVKIGDDTSIGAESQLLGYRVEDGMLIVGSIEIGDRCFVGIHSTFGLNAKMGDDTSLDDLSLLPDGAVMACGESRRGSPAEVADVSLPDVSATDRSTAKRRHPFLFAMLQFVASELVGELLLMTTIPSAAIVLAAYQFFGLGWALASTIVAVPIGVVWFCLLVAFAKSLILHRATPGVYSVESWYYLRKWTVDLLISDSRGIMLPLFTTIYLPTWLRMLGAKIGARAEISTVTNLAPDLIEIADESFFADGSMVGGRRFFRGSVQIGKNRIGTRTFVGNNAHVPVGASLGDNCLLGVVSAPPGGVGSETPDDTDWLGSPPFRLPHRQKVGGFDPSQTFRPTLRLYILRYLIDGARILLPFYLSILGVVAYSAIVLAALSWLPWWSLWGVVPAAACAVVFALVMSVVLVKKALMGRFKPVVKPLWCVYVWFNELVNGAYESLVSPLLVPTLGTPAFNWYLRRLGSKVGKHTFLETDLFSEFDLVDIGDYAALNLGVVVQNHLFEDRIMKSSYLRIGDECSVGNMSVVLYDTEMSQASSIGPLSLLMKGETLAPNTRWIGIPTRQV